MASMITRRKRVDYFALNDGSDEEALPDRLNDARSDSSAEILPDSELFASESSLATEPSMEIQDDNAICQPPGQTSRHIETSTNSKGWQCWDHFNITERNESWILKKSNVRKLVENFTSQRLQLKEVLLQTCRTIALSLDMWTSRNNLPILGMIGHWLMR
ncbi:hypothetical protein V1508DRAFT_443830 [Lipomyces doorenjongii]|uniref:uncharacterized protein n=1 Tax=Lipomyces doorenjongii TaxID=383834 RepID=UPI0034CF45F6